MEQGRAPSPVRASLFYSICLLLLISLGLMLQTRLKLPSVMLNQLLIFLGLSLGFALLVDRRPPRELFRMRPLSANGTVKSFFLGLLAWATIQTMGTLLVMLVEGFGGQVPTPHQDLLNAPFLAALTAGALLPAICEEVAFRGYIQWGLSPLGPRAAVILTGVLFGAMHLSLVRGIPLAVLGVIYAYVVQRTGSILPGMIMHFVNNATALSLAFLVPTDAMEPSEPQGLSILVLLFTLAGLGAAVWSLARSFGPGDLAGSPATGLPSPMGAQAAAEDTQAPTPDAATGSAEHRPREPRFLFILPLLPAVLIYLFAVFNELVFMF